MKIPLAPPSLADLVRKNNDLQGMLRGSPLVGGRYLHWDQLRHREPPEGLSHEKWWAGVKLARQGLLRALPLVDKHGRPIQFAMPDPVQRAVHNIDRQAAGSVAMPRPLVSEGERDRYLVSSLIEEAITSSQLEGASTSPAVAKDMLRSGRKPRDRSEQIILNNFRVMQVVREMSSANVTNKLWNYCNALRNHVINDSCAILGAFEPLP